MEDQLLEQQGRLQAALCLHLGPLTSLVASIIVIVRENEEDDDKIMMIRL